MIEVPVGGGTLSCKQWGDQGPVVLAAHGVTATHVSFTAVGEKLAGQVRLVAPDLRGRGASAGLPGPFGMNQHADDLMAVLDHLGEERAVIAGHSMGAYVATAAAARHPDRVEAVLLSDGGLPLQVPEGLSVDQALELVVGPAVARLSMTFPSREAYHDFWKAHPALGAEWGPLAEAYVDYDLVGEEPELRSRVSAEAVLSDSADTLTSDVVTGALERSRCPVYLLRAERGMLGEETPLLPDALVEPWRHRVTDLGAVAGVNHYTLVLSDRGATAVADAIGTVLSAAASGGGRTRTTPG